MCGSYVSVDYIQESIRHAADHGPTYAKLKAKYTPPLMPDHGDPGWTMICEGGHMGYSEYLIYWDQREDTNPVDQFYVETSKMNINKVLHVTTGFSQPVYLTGPKLGQIITKWLLKIKEELIRWVCLRRCLLLMNEFVNVAPDARN